MDSGSPFAPARAAARIDQFFDEVLGCMRAQRRAREEAPGVAVEDDRRWSATVVEALRLHARLRRDPRVLAFGVSPDQSEIAVEVAGRRGHAYFTLCAVPPAADAAAAARAWLRQLGQADAAFDDPMDGLRELARRLARLLA